MKNLFLSFCIPIFLFGCKKDDANAPASTGNILTSIRADDYSGTNVLSVDSFSYDNSGRLLQIIHWDYDNAQGNSLYDSMTWKFTYNGSGNAPATYSSAYTVINQAAAHKDITDTIFMNNGNISKFSAYADSLGTGNFDFGYAYNYVGTPNPLYNSTISASIGPLLYVRTYLDFISKYLPAGSKDIFYAPDLTYSYTTNSLGLPVKGLGKEKTTGELETSITYSYK